MSNYLARLFYLGDRYYGSQYQPGFNTVQGNLIEAIERWSGDTHSPQTVQISGRTDRGVHSIGQLVMVAANKQLDVDRINKYLPEDIQLWASTKAPDGFKSRHSVLMRHYRYFLVDYWKDIDSTLVKRAISLLIGSNDFAHLSKPDSGRSTMTTILNISFQQLNNVCFLDFFGTRFLWKQVRKIVTLFTDIGIGKIQLDKVENMLNAQISLPSGIRPAPPENLVLVETVVPVKLKTSKYAIHRIMAHLNDKLDFYKRSTSTINSIINFFPSELGMTYRRSTKQQSPSALLD
ncbi:MAG: tRNA pseudouridine(38-40) synthase TruA [Promethearchaeota archaeon]